jgi:hypothetical protein
MILFKPEHVEPILRGQKTQTRRTGHKRWKVRSVHQAKTNYKDAPFADLLITRVRSEQLGAISENDARKEGYPSVEAYQEAFGRIYGWWKPKTEVWVLDFEVIPNLNEKEGD